MYFKSNYTPGIKYSPGWYGTLNYAPLATILLYNDEDGYCIGTINETIAGIEYITEEAALTIINAVDLTDPLIFTGDKLLHKWDREEIPVFEDPRKRKGFPSRPVGPIKP